MEKKWYNFIISVDHPSEETAEEQGAAEPGKTPLHPVARLKRWRKSPRGWRSTPLSNCP
jgi:hypothetical protein